jgi:hypothetical protein
MYATLETHERWLQPFWSNLPYRHTLSAWDGESVLCTFNIFISSRPRVELIEDVRRRKTPNKGFHDFDLVAKLRATSGPLKLPSGCDSDIVVDAKLGLHVTNTGGIWFRMMYEHEVLVLTQRCHEGHLEHFASWGVPYYERALYSWMREVILRLLTGHWDNHLVKRRAFEILSSRVK